MNPEREIPIACDLTTLSREQREREQALLAQFRKTARRRGSGENLEFFLPADPHTLAELGEFLGLERLCCPFLTFDLRIDAAGEARLTVSGPPGAKEFVTTEFGG